MRITVNTLLFYLIINLMLVPTNSKGQSDKQKVIYRKALNLPYGGQRTFQIGIWYYPILERNNEKQLKMMKDAHIDLIHHTNKIEIGIDTEEDNLRMLRLAHKYGIKLFVGDSRIEGSANDIKDMIDSYKSHPATAGYNVMDEPFGADLDKCASIYRTILEFDSNKIVNVNLNPIYAPIPNYEKDYVEAWVKKVGASKLKYLSFDYYPYSANGSFRDSFYINLDIIRRIGLKYDIKTGSYLQSVGIIPANSSKATGHRRPNKNELRHNVYTTLAYGIKYPVWFTYWGTRSAGSKYETLTSAILDSFSRKTDLYEPFRQLNWEMKQLGKTLIDLDAVDVFHTGNINISGRKIPEGLKLLPADFVFQPQDASAELIITSFIHRKTNQRYIMIVNKSYTVPTTLSFRLNKMINNIKRISPDTGKPELVNLDSITHIFTESFLPGHGYLYWINN